MRIIRSLVATTLAIIVPEKPGFEYKTPVINSELVSIFNGENNISLPMAVTKSINSTYKVISTIYNPVQNTKLYTKTYTYSDMGATGSSFPRRFDINLPFKGRLKADGLKVEFEYKNGTTQLDLQSVIVYPYIKKSINVTQYKTENYIARGNYILVQEMKMYADEEFIFKDLNDFISLGSNGKIDLSTINFKYNAPIDFACGDICLHIKDYKDVFPQLQSSNKNITLKMKATQNEELISLSLDEQLYVNEDTLEMSKTNLPNTVPVNDLFVGAGKEELLYDDEFYITINDAGVSLTDITMPFNFYLSKKYVGQCYESDFCITGGIKK